MLSVFCEGLMKIDLFGDNKGSVEYITHMGSDLTIVNAARVSFGAEKEQLDEKDIKLKNRDQLLMFTLTTLSFLLYGNMLRFKWAYVENNSLTLDVLMMAWLSTLFFINIRT